MKPQRQKHLFRDGSGVVGDCHRTCIAMILNMDRDDVPHFMADVPYGDSADSPAQVAAARAEHQWLTERGLATVNIPYDGRMPLVDILAQLKVFAQAPVVLGCKSRNGVNHSVVVHEGVVHNPNGDPDGIAGPMRDGMWWITIYAVGPNWRPLPPHGDPATVATQED